MIPIYAFQKRAASGLDLSSLAWTGWWTGDDYNATTGVATGQASAGSSSGRDFTSPGTKPAKGNTVNGNGHNGIIFDGTDKHLASTATVGDLCNANAFTAYIVVNYGAFGTSGGAGYALPAVISDVGSYWAQGGADGATPKKAVAYYFSAGAVEIAARATVTVDTTHLLEITLAAGTLSISVDGGTPVTQSGADINAAGLTQTLVMGSNYNQGALLTGTVYEVLVSDADLSASASAIRTALATKYGITL